MEDVVKSILNAGAVGAVLAWLLWKIEPRLSAVEDSIDRLTKAQMLFMVSQPVSPYLKTQAEDIIKEIDGKSSARG